MARRVRPADPRIAEMARRYADGATLQAIGKEFGVTRERVRQLIAKGGYEMSDLKPAAAAARRRQIVEERGEAIRTGLRNGQIPSAVAAELRVPLGVVQEIDATDPAFARTRKVARRKGGSLKYAEDEVVQCLHLASDQLGGVLTTAEYTRFTRGRTFDDGRPWPTHQTAALRFGSWRAALEAAGLRANPSTPIAGRQLFTEGNCIDAILEVERALGHLPSVKEYEKYAMRMAGAIPSSATIRHRFGRWPDALRQAVDFASSYDGDNRP